LTSLVNAYNPHCPPNQTNCKVFEYGMPTSADIEYIRELLSHVDSEVKYTMLLTAGIGTLTLDPLATLIIGYQSYEKEGLNQLDKDIFSPVGAALKDPANSVEMYVFSSNETRGIKSVGYTVKNSDGDVTSGFSFTPDSVLASVYIRLLIGRQTDVYLPQQLP